MTAKGPLVMTLSLAVMLLIAVTPSMPCGRSVYAYKVRK